MEALAGYGDFPVYDLGGGLGVALRKEDDAPSIGEYMEVLVGTARRMLGSDRSLLFEPGRSIVGPAGTMLYRVQTVKRDRVTHVAVDGGSSDNLEATESKLCWDAAVANRPGREERCVLVGMHCDSGDQLIDDVGLASPHPGDVIAMAVAGAYSFACASNFNAVRRAPVVFCEDGTAREIVRRETWDELFSRETE